MAIPFMAFEYSLVTPFVFLLQKYELFACRANNPAFLFPFSLFYCTFAVDNGEDAFARQNESTLSFVLA